MRKAIPTCAGLNEVDTLLRYRLLTGLQPKVDPSAGVAALPFLSYGFSVPAAIAAINTQIGASQLSFDALAPVMLVHGIRVSNFEDWFGNYTHSPAGASTYQNNWFEQPFKDAHASFASFVFNENLISLGGANLTQPIAQAAAAFGAQHIHIVAHSMGGLWARSFMVNQLPTLSTKL